MELDRPTRTAIVVGGAIGTGLRALVAAAVPLDPTADFPWATLAANVTGALVLAFVVARVPERRRDATYVGLTTGLLGAYTTFSAFALEIRLLLPASPAAAAAYTAASLIIGLAAAGVGFRLGRHRQRDPRRPARP